MSENVGVGGATRVSLAPAAGFHCKQGIELLELAPLALPAHPHPVAGIPDPWPVEEVEDAGTVLAIRFVEALHAGPRETDQLFITRLGRLRGIAEIRDQGKEQVGVAVAQIAYLQGFQKTRHALGPSQHGGNDHHGAVSGRDPLGEIQARQYPGGHRERDQHVDDGDDQGGGRDKADDGEEDGPPVALLERHT